MKKSYIIAALALTSCMIVGTAAASQSNSVTATFRPDVTLKVNGTTYTIRDTTGVKVSPLIYNGTTYLPLSSLGQLLGADVSWDNASQTVIIHDDDTSYIGETKAKELALKHAGLSSKEVSFLQLKLDWDDGRMKYEVEFYSGTTEYDYDIDAVTGAILSSDRELENFQIWNNGTSRPSGNGSNSSSGDYITAERAQQIALAETPSGSTVVKCQFDWDDGRAQYEVEIRNGWTEYEFEIDAVTGTIFSRDIDNDRW